MKTLSATAAYNRSYKTEADLLADWQAGKDFRIVGGPYFSIRDRKLILDEGYDKVKINFALTKTCTIDL